MNFNINPKYFLHLPYEYLSIRKLAYASMKTGRVKNKKWLKSFLNLTNVSIYVGNSRLSSRNEKKKYIRRVLETIDAFQNKWEDDWDIHISFSERNYITLNFIHLYKSVEVSNSNGLKHTIKDLFLCFSWYGSGENVFTPNLSGFRITHTPAELAIAYGHSHLSRLSLCDDLTNITTNFMQNTKFCIGGRSETNNVIDDMTLDYHPQKIELLLYTMDSYVAWESLEGGPYVKISDMVEHRTKVYSISSEMCESYAHSFLETFDEEYGNYPLDVDFFVKNNKIKVNATHKTISYLTELFVERYGKEHLVKKQLGTDTYYAYLDAILTGDAFKYSSDLQQYYFYYRTEQKKLKIVFPKKVKKIVENINIEEYYLHPKLIKYVITTLEQRLYKRSIEISRAVKQNSLSNSR